MKNFKFSMGFLDTDLQYLQIHVDTVQQINFIPQLITSFT